MAARPSAGVGDVLINSRNTALNATLNQLSDNKPRIVLTEQPKSRGMRFRYQCEGRSAGAIPGENSTNDRRTYPTIKIENMNGPSAIVVVSCVTKDDPPRPHPHSLVGKDCKQGVCTVKLKGTNTVSFPNLGIQCCTRRQVQDMLKTREQIRVDPWGTGFYTNIQQMDLNTVRLAFQAFLPDSRGKYTNIVSPVVSACIYDKKAVNDLVICRLSKQAGSVKGGDEVFILCEKVSKDDIQVRFFEEDQTGGTVWEAFGYFGQQDVHRQYAIVFKTPPYQDQNISQPVNVYIQLRRPSDDGISDPKPFQYIPDDPDPDCIQRKRKRKLVDFNFLGPLLESEPPDAKRVIRENILHRREASAPTPIFVMENAAHPVPSTSSGQGVPTSVSGAHYYIDPGVDVFMIDPSQISGSLLDNLGALGTLPSLSSLPSLPDDVGAESSNLAEQHGYINTVAAETEVTETAHF